MKSFRTILKKEKGFTLTETIVYVAILGIVMSGIIMIVVQLIKMKTTADSLSIIGNEATNLFEKMGYDIKNADSFNVVDTSTIQIIRDGTTYQYSLEGTEIMLGDGFDTFPVTTNMIKVTGLNIIDWTTVNSDNLVHIEVQFSRGNLVENFETNLHKR
ncbi:MAG: type II secretion system protein [Patescibacteria group bacterium]|nr:type II secretion system GspH family protein [Patescibacteria group bacterium]